MFRNVKGVKIREYDETVSKGDFADKMFEIEYKDNQYLHQMIFLDFLTINVKDLGRKWIFVVKNDDYFENKKEYGEIVKIIYDKVRDYFMNIYNNMPDFVLIDHESKVYQK